MAAITGFRWWLWTKIRKFKVNVNWTSASMPVRLEASNAFNWSTSTAVVHVVLVNFLTIPMRIYFIEPAVSWSRSGSHRAVFNIVSLIFAISWYCTLIFTTRVTEAKDLAVVNGSCNPYALISLRGPGRVRDDVKQTAAKRKTANPCFDETFIFDVSKQRWDQWQVLTRLSFQFDKKVQSTNNNDSEELRDHEIRSVLLLCWWLTLYCVVVSNCGTTTVGCRAKCLDPPCFPAHF